LSKPTLSGHFSVLKEAGLVLTERRGTQVIYSLNLSLLEGALLGLMRRVSRDDQGAEVGQSWSFDKRGGLPGCCSRRSSRRPCGRSSISARTICFRRLSPLPSPSRSGAPPSFRSGWPCSGP